MGSMEAVSKPILVLGWYGNGNVGDEAFRTALRSLLPDLWLVFSSDPKELKRGDYGGVIVGGGDLLNGDQFVNFQSHVPLAVLGVGFGSLTPKAKALLDQAALVVVRDRASQRLYPRAVLAADLCFAIPFPESYPRQRKVTVLLNDFFGVKRHKEVWTGAWAAAFNLEFAKVCDHYANDGLTVQFLPMQTGAIDDRRAAGTLISAMSHPDKVRWSLDPQNELTILEEIATSELVITQRLHGVIFSVLTDTPCVAIAGHSKVWNLCEEIGWRGIIDYYGLTDKNFYHTVEKNITPFAEYRQRSHKVWLDLRESIVNVFTPSAAVP